MKTQKPFDRKNNIIIKDINGKEFYLLVKQGKRLPVPEQMTKKEIDEYIDELECSIDYRETHSDIIDKENLALWDSNQTLERRNKKLVLSIFILAGISLVMFPFLFTSTIDLITYFN